MDQVIRRGPGCGSRAVPGGGRSHASPPGSSKARTDVARFRRPRTRTGCLSASRGAFVQHITVDRVQGARFVQVHDPLVACLCAGPRGWSSRLRIVVRTRRLGSDASSHRSLKGLSSPLGRHLDTPKLAASVSHGAAPRAPRRRGNRARQQPWLNRAPPMSGLLGSHVLSCDESLHWTRCDSHWPLT